MLHNSVALRQIPLAMSTLLHDITASLQRILDYPLLPRSGITVASLLVLIALFGLVIIGVDYQPGETSPYDLSMDKMVALDSGADFVGKPPLAAVADEPSRRHGQKKKFSRLLSLSFNTVILSGVAASQSGAATQSKDPYVLVLDEAAGNSRQRNS